MNLVISVIVGLVALVIGLFAGYVLRKSIGEKEIGSAEQKAQNILLDAETSAENKQKEMILEAKEEAHKLRSDVEKEIRDRRNEINKTEKRIQGKEENIDRKMNSIERREQELTKKEHSMQEKHKEIDEYLQKQVEELEKISGYSREEARHLLLEEIEKDVRKDASAMITQVEAEAKEEADKRAKDIITLAIQRCAADQVAESTVSVVQLPNDDMKGRIIGREGRNIRAIETLTGVDLIIDDTPEAVILSGFDPIRREIAKIALEKLIVDGRIHPARIEEMVQKATKEVNNIIKEEGEQACFETGVHNLNPEMVKLLGRLKYRTSYGQNVLKHSIEVSLLAGLMASELGYDTRLAKRAGLLHDIGKSIDHEVEGTHVEIGVNICKKYKEPWKVINAVEAHHGDTEPTTMEAVLVSAADALSAARPGARRETLESYIKRLETLETIANSTKGVERSYAIQAGREIRIIVKPNQVKDNEVPMLARDVAKKIESELEYPGHIKVNVIRETRAVDYAK
ncbi:MAG: ribonuclease Y [Eubacteriales bacterium]|jgi:ribonuclease Y|uniref:Ribonuclease Y n=3 Tax=Baileyella intestinalis TaxID=2606709 RepID=A0A6A8MAD4_9FIRM|nr:ribonuclease Y [Baileyella intestinalis]MCI7686531.1 ribonuclease Y [Clostridiales bacterium]MDY2995358.1 ribonuclease Y [Baileyella intestinalis]MST68266.1 ribonuclease Y [Baileyella intestinalis]